MCMLKAHILDGNTREAEQTLPGPGRWEQLWPKPDSTGQQPLCTTHTDRSGLSRCRRTCTEEKSPACVRERSPLPAPPDPLFQQ